MTDQPVVCSGFLLSLGALTRIDDASPACAPFCVCAKLEGVILSVLVVWLMLVLWIFLAYILCLHNVGYFIIIFVTSSNFLDYVMVLLA